MAEYVIAGLAALLLVSEVRHWHALRRADAWMRAAAAWRTASLADTVERARSDAYAAALTDAVQRYRDTSRRATLSVERKASARSWLRRKALKVVH